MENQKMRSVDSRWATALAGFMAGAVSAAIVLVPWMVFQGAFCDESSYQRVVPPTGAEFDAAPIEVPAAPAI